MPDRTTTRPTSAERAQPLWDLLYELNAREMWRQEIADGVGELRMYALQPSGRMLLVQLYADGNGWTIFDEAARGLSVNDTLRMVRDLAAWRPQEPAFDEGDLVEANGGPIGTWTGRVTRRSGDVQRGWHYRITTGPSVWHPQHCMRHYVPEGAVFSADDGWRLTWRDGRWTDGDLSFRAGDDGRPITDSGEKVEGHIVDDQE